MAAHVAVEAASRATWAVGVPKHSLVTSCPPFKFRDPTVSTIHDGTSTGLSPSTFQLESRGTQTMLIETRFLNTFSGLPVWFLGL